MVAALMLGGALPLAASVAPAQATQTQICGNSGSGYCMNNWNDAFQSVKMYYGSSSNEAFVTVQINPCNSNPPGFVTSTCPFAVGSGYNSALEGEPIFEVQYIGYLGTSYCVGSTGVQAGGATAVMVGCPNNNGSGGGNGTIWVAWGGQGSYTGYVITRYWADYYYTYFGQKCCNTIPSVFSGGSLGAPLFMGSQTNATQWGGPGWTLVSY